jgi:5-methylcytosine-specific restriction endonuclease McrA
MPIRNSVRQLHDRAIVVANQIHLSQNELIQILQDLDQCGGFRDFGCTSLWQYCLKMLKLEEYQASNLITVARKAREVPELKAALDNGSVQVSKARRISAVLTSDNKSHWIELAQTLTKKDLEKEIARHSPKHATRERIEYVSGERIQFQCGLDEKDYQELLQVRDLVAQNKRQSVDLEQTLVELIKVYKQVKDPLMKAQRAKLRREKKVGCAARRGLGTVNSNVPKQKRQSFSLSKQDPSLSNSRDLSLPNQFSELSNKTRQYPASLEHEINLRDGRQCTNQDENGVRCTERCWLEFHHVIPIELGGLDTLENLRTLCWSHHRIIHDHKGVSDQTRNYVLKSTG